MKWLAAIPLVLSLHGYAQFQIVRIDTTEDQGPPRNPSVAIDAKDPDRILTVTAEGDAYLSTNGGQSWVKRPTGIREGEARDIDVFSTGKEEFVCTFVGKAPGSGVTIPMVRRSTDAGKTWAPPVPVTETRDRYAADLHGFLGPKSDLLLAWTQMSSAPATDGCTAEIMFSISGNTKSWSKPVSISGIPGICGADEPSIWNGSPVVTVDGKIFVLWVNDSTVYMDRSFNKDFWLHNDIVAARFTQRSTITSDHGTLTFGIDNSKGSYRGSIYIVWSEAGGQQGNAMINLIRSVSYGDYWSQAQHTIEATDSSSQLLPSIAVDHATGLLCIAYYAIQGNEATVHLAVSPDGGSNFKDHLVSSAPFRVDDPLILRNRLAIDVRNERIALVWAEYDKGIVVLSSCIFPRDQLKK